MKFDENYECGVCNKSIKFEETHQLTTGEQVCMKCYEKLAVLAQPND
jgi:hypothetical protein